MSEEIKLYPNIKKIECAFQGASIGNSKCKLYPKKVTLDSPLFWEVNPDCVNIHPFWVTNIQFSADMGGNHAVLEVCFHKDEIINCELKEVNDYDYKGDFLECKRIGSDLLEIPEYGSNWERW